MRHDVFIFLVVEFQMRVPHHVANPHCTSLEGVTGDNSSCKELGHSPEQCRLAEGNPRIDLATIPVLATHFQIERYSNLLSMGGGVV